MQKEEQCPRWKLRFARQWLLPCHRSSPKPLPWLKNSVADPVKSDSLGGSYEAACIVRNHAGIGDWADLADEEEFSLAPRYEHLYSRRWIP